MSHRATNWALEQRGLKPGLKIVLFALADRHNPDFGCFPSQKKLADDCEISRATLNRYLTELEARGFIRREQQTGEKNEKISTRYYLAFEFADHVSNCDKPHVSNCDKPHVSDCDTNLVIEINPVREIMLAPDGASDRAEVDPLHGFDEFWNVYDHKKARPRCEAIWKRKHLSRIADEVIAGADAYVRGDGKDKRYRKYPEGWLNAQRWSDNQSERIQSGHAKTLWDFVGE